MAEFAFGLTKTAVEGTVSTVKSAIEDEAKLNEKVQHDLEFITAEFQMMQSSLSVAKRERAADNEVVRTWVRLLRDLAFDVEDCVEFVVHLEKRSSSAWLWRTLPSCLVPPQHLDLAAAEIKQLKARVEDVSHRNMRYNLTGDLAGSSHSISKPAEQPATTASPSAFHILRELHGMGDLRELITGEGGDDLQVISVWGSTGGDLGARSMIMETYCHGDICDGFKSRAWVKLVQPFNPNEFLKSLLTQLCRRSWSSHHQADAGEVEFRTRMKAAVDEDDHLMKAELMQQLMKHKRYLVVLEDVSTVVEWDDIKMLLPDCKNGSRIIVSTHDIGMAFMCTGKPYLVSELRRFPDGHSLCALFRKLYLDLASAGGLTDVERESINGIVDDIEEADLIQRCCKLLREKVCLVVINGLRRLEVGLDLFLQLQEPGDYGVVSVWGIAAVGKSDIVRTCYYHHMLNTSPWFRLGDQYLHFDLMKRFAKYSWVRVPHPFNLTEFSRRLLVDFYSDDLQAMETVAVGIMQGQDLIEECRKLLRQENYFVVVEGLGSTDAWDSIKEAFFPQPVDGCIVVIITNEASVARHCQVKEQRRVNVKGLQADEAHNLFIKVHLHTLKPCIFYLLVFPVDHNIRQRRLLRRWIAEGYSRDKASTTAEEEGRRLFSDLIDLSIIQVQDTPSETLHQQNGFLHEYIVSRPMEDNLVFTLEGHCTLSSQRAGKHLTIRSSWDRDKVVFKSIDFSRLRSLTVFGKWRSFFVSANTNMRLLRVLDLEDTSGVTDDDLEHIAKLLPRLKFLSLRGCREITYLPNSLGGLRQLQTLDVKHTSIVTLPPVITKLEKLQYINAGTTEPIDDLTSPAEAASGSLPAAGEVVGTSTPPPWSSRAQNFVSGCLSNNLNRSKQQAHNSSVKVPAGIGRLTMLQTLGVVNVGGAGRKAISNELKMLTQLRKLGVSGINQGNYQKLFSAISDHAHLVSLSVRLDKDKEGAFCCLDGISKPPKTLKSLKLYGHVHKLPDWMRQLDNLSKVDLEITILTQKDTRFYEQFPSQSIHGRVSVKPIQVSQVHFGVPEDPPCRPWTKQFRIFKIDCTTRLQANFGEDYITSSVQLLVVHCSSGSSLQISGLEHLLVLKEVWLKGSYSYELWQQLKQQLSEHPKKPVLKPEIPPFVMSNEY
ncbi:hypothetical protein SETIT_7G011700v2 [Setaria italica]|uniref:Rx N-terminal domain-containing protein n=2 Tax=Setaria italica TaxID=4555 RepID=A0A368RR08_SETIT|nr:hypothetical protein SETIT_7G011700v2 [Setaria italica]